MSSFTTDNKKNYSVELEAYHQSGNICAFLNVSIENVKTGEENNLTERFAVLEATADYRLSSSNSSSFLEWLFPSILRQFTVVRCAFEQQLSGFNSETAKDTFAAMEAKGFESVVLPMLIVPSVVVMLSVLFNISLVIVTARKISMSTGCNWLLAFDSTCQVPALLPFLVNLFALCARLDAIDYRVCLTSLMLSTGSSYASFLAIYFISLERLLIVLMPMRMSQMNEKYIKWLSLLSFLACTCFGLAMVLSIFSVIQQPSPYSNINEAFDRRVYCNTGFYGYSLSIYRATGSHTVLGLALLNYAFMAGLLFWRRIFLPRIGTHSNINAVNSQATYRMLRSMFVISVVLIIGWLIGSVLFIRIEGDTSMLTSRIGRELYPDSEVDAERFSYNAYNWAIGLTMCMFPMVAGINAPVLIINNSDYREGYKKMLAPLLKIVCRKHSPPTSVGPLFINQLDHHLHH